MNNLDTLAQEVWRTKSLVEAKEKLHKMVQLFKYKEKQQSFNQQINRIHSLNEAFILAKNIALADMKVI